MIIGAGLKRFQGLHPDCGPYVWHSCPRDFTPCYCYYFMSLCLVLLSAQSISAYSSLIVLSGTYSHVDVYRRAVSNSYVTLSLAMAQMSSCTLEIFVLQVQIVCLCIRNPWFLTNLRFWTCRFGGTWILWMKLELCSAHIWRVFWGPWRLLPASLAFRMFQKAKNCHFWFW